jgi:hypothetical protein
MFNCIFPKHRLVHEMPLIMSELKDVVPSVALSSCFFLLRGRADILRMQGVLVRLSILCDQTGVMDYLEYFLTLTENIKKTPYLVVIASRPHIEVFELQAEDLIGAVLIYEYKMLGLSSKVFSTGDYNGSRTVIAPLAIRARIAAMVCRYLIEYGAHTVLLSLSGAFEAGHASYPDGTDGGKKLLWTTQSREVGASLPLEDTVDATLAQLGCHTRRNLRYYRRKAEAELACTFAYDVRGTLTRVQFIELNRASTHPAPNDLLNWRYATLKTLEGGFCVGVRSSTGEWISLMAGRRHHDVTEIDWQMNRGALAKYSVGTVIRSYLIDHEISLGMRRLFFEGGTTHTLRHSFLPETAIDIIAVRQFPSVSLLRRGIEHVRLKKTFLVQVLADPSLKWELR